MPVYPCYCSHSSDTLFYFSPEQASAILHTEDWYRNRLGHSLHLCFQVSSVVECCPIAKVSRNRFKTSSLFSLLLDSHYTQVSIYIQTSLDTGVHVVLPKSVTTLLPHNLSYLEDFLVSVGGDKAQNTAQDPASTQVHFWLFTSLTDCIRELQHQADHM